MAPALRQNSPNAVGDTDADEFSATVLVTGFGPFREQYPVNPSWEIANSLPSKIPLADKNHKPIRILTCGQPIRVSYDEARQTMSRLLQDHKGQINLVLNMGMAPGNDFYSLERFARRSGYIAHQDLDGLVPSEEEGRTQFSDCPEIMTTSLDYSVVFDDWQNLVNSAVAGTEHVNINCRKSDDAGRYLCDYTYFNSLTWFGRQSKEMESGGKRARPVLFLHVPGESTPTDLERGRIVTTALIQAMVKNYLGE